MKEGLVSFSPSLFITCLTHHSELMSVDKLSPNRKATTSKNTDGGSGCDLIWALPTVLPFCVPTAHLVWRVPVELESALCVLPISST